MSGAGSALRPDPAAGEDLGEHVGTVGHDAVDPEVHEPLDFLERQRFSTRLVLLCLIHVLHSLGFYTSNRGKVRPRR